MNGFYPIFAHSFIKTDKYKNCFALSVKFKKTLGIQ